MNNWMHWVWFGAGIALGAGGVLMASVLALAGRLDDQDEARGIRRS